MQGWRLLAAVSAGQVGAGGLPHSRDGCQGVVPAVAAARRILLESPWRVRRLSHVHPVDLFRQVLNLLHSVVDRHLTVDQVLLEVIESLGARVSALPVAYGEGQSARRCLHPTLLIRQEVQPPLDLLYILPCSMQHLVRPNAVELLIYVLLKDHQALVSLRFDVLELLVHLVHGGVDHAFEVAKDRHWLVVAEPGFELLQVRAACLLVVELRNFRCDLHKPLLKCLQSQVGAGNAVLPRELFHLAGLLAPDPNGLEHLGPSEMVKHVLAPLVGLLLAFRVPL